MEGDARTFATGLRIRHKDAALKITAWSKPEDVLPPDLVRRHGLEFGRLVVAEISQMNHDEVSNFARDFSNRYQANPRQLIHAISRPVVEVFSKEERERHGETFLGLVINNCYQAMKCLEGVQIAEKTGTVSQSQTEISQGTRTDISQKQTGISRAAQTEITSDIISSSQLGDGPSAPGRRVTSDSGPPSMTGHTQKRILSAPEKLPLLHVQTITPAFRSAPLYTGQSHGTDLVRYQRAHAPQYAFNEPYSPIHGPDGLRPAQTRLEMDPRGPTPADARYPRHLVRDGYSGFLEAHRYPDTSVPYTRATPYRHVGAGNLQGRPHQELLASGPQYQVPPTQLSHQSRQQWEKGLAMNPEVSHFPPNELEGSGPISTQHPRIHRYSNRGGKGKSFRRDSFKDENAQQQAYGRHYDHQSHQRNFSGNAPAEYHKRRMPPNEPTKDRALEPFPDFKENYPGGWSQTGSARPGSGDMVGHNFIGDNINDIFSVWVGDIPPDVTEKQVEDLFTTKVSPACVGAMRREHERSHCFVEFQSTNDVRRALNLDGAVVFDWWKLRVRVPLRFINHPQVYDKRARYNHGAGRYDNQNYKPGRRSTTGSRPSIARKGSQPHGEERSDGRHVEPPSSHPDGVPGSEAKSCLLPTSPEVGEDISRISSAPVAATKGSSDVSEPRSEVTDSGPKFHIPHKPELSAAGLFRSNSVLPRLENTEQPALAVISRTTAISEGARDSMPEFPFPRDQTISNIPSSQSAAEAAEASVDTRTQLIVSKQGNQPKPGSQDKQSKLPVLEKNQRTPLVSNQDKNIKLPNLKQDQQRTSLVCELDKKSKLLVLEQEKLQLLVSEQDIQPTLGSEQEQSSTKDISMVTPKEKERPQGRDKSQEIVHHSVSTSVSSIADMPPTVPPETKDGCGTKATAEATKIERQEDNEGFSIPKADRPKSPQPARDDWVHPFARQKALEKQQKQAAKNQKKKEKKNRQPSKGGPGSKQKQGEITDVETTEAAQKTRIPTPEQGQRTAETTETQKIPTPTLDQEQLAQVKAVQSADVGYSNAKEVNDLYDVSDVEETKLKETKRTAKSKEDGAKVQETSQKPTEKKPEIEPAEGYAPPRLPTPQFKVDECTGIDDKPFRVKAGQNRVTDEGATGPKSEKASTPKRKRKNKKSTARGGADKPADGIVDKPTVGQDGHPSLVSPIPKQPYRVLFDDEPPRVVDGGGKYASAKNSERFMLMRGQSSAPEQRYPQSLRFNSVGFPMANLVVRDTEAMTSVVPKMMPRHNQQEMERYHQPFVDPAPPLAYAGGTASLSPYDTSVKIGSPERARGGNSPGTPSKTLDCEAPPNTPADGVAKEDGSSFQKLLKRLEATNPMRLRPSSDAESSVEDSPEYANWDRTSPICNMDNFRRTYAPHKNDEADHVAKDELAKDCAICFRPFQGEETVVFCTHACGSDFHADCLDRWVDSKIKQGARVACPLCRMPWPGDDKKDEGGERREGRSRRGTLIEGIGRVIGFNM